MCTMFRVVRIGRGYEERGSWWFGLACMDLWKNEWRSCNFFLNFFFALLLLQLRGFDHLNLRLGLAKQAPCARLQRLGE